MVIGMVINMAPLCEHVLQRYLGIESQQKVQHHEIIYSSKQICNSINIFGLYLESQIEGIKAFWLHRAASMAIDSDSIELTDLAHWTPDTRQAHHPPTLRVVTLDVLRGHEKPQEASHDHY